ncbi:cupin domain-containing protein [Mariprofundus sp. KV]|uniref:cupin domain-containing protein n=1 Tax=Mariprofundus sp. KV TaxID=2608715 RepID=UPI0015A4D9CC|nr:cupin domain-containing protein [Mariprofundus sp. KV]NWF36090.1 cupin domain-containing protein [Mariprofundus sp. KV]
MKVVNLEMVAVQAVAHDPEIKKRVLLHESELPCSVRLSQAILAPGQQVSAHHHEHICEVFYLLSGEGEFIVDGESVKVGEGSTIRIDAGEVHAVVNSSDKDMSLLYFGLPA